MVSRDRISSDDPGAPQGAVDAVKSSGDTSAATSEKDLDDTYQGFKDSEGLEFTEQLLRLEAYYWTSGIAAMFGGLVGYAVRHIGTGLPRWMRDLDPVVTAVGAQILNLALTSFASTIIGSFGFEQLSTQYMQIWGGAGAMQFLALISGGVCTRWPDKQCITMTVANAIRITGMALLIRLPDGSKICDVGLGFSMSLTMVSLNIAGSAKKQLIASILFTGYCLRNHRTSGFHIERGRPLPHAYIAMLIGYSVELVAILVLYSYMYHANKARDAAGPADERVNF
ncbi:hypothetical protein DL770_002978 [Monosporascus sp. CRB-9-2]|nr:hypothetical protein DL770_002978 [Monosporascus sp. CRB-9-2]